jgi:hypothetical protein
MLEKHIESKVCEYARDRACLAYKFTSPARSAVPDRMFISPAGVIWFCEFKREGQKPTPQQDREHTRLRDYGVKVFVIDNVADGRVMVDMMVGVV